MQNNLLRMMVVLAGLMLSAFAHATTTWSAQDYDLYSGDFNGDGKTDILYVAKDPSKPSGIAISDGTAPNIAWQTWPSNYLGIPWSGNQYNVIVGDFNGDGKSDIFLQRVTPGDSYLLLTDGSGKVTAISQTVSSGALGLVWSADQHKIVAGDFNGDGKADLFLQATNASGVSAVVVANATGQFTTGPLQSWNDTNFGFNWSTQSSIVYVGDFNGDGKADLLVQAKPKFVMIDYDVNFPVPTYPPNKNGVVISQGGTTPFQQAGVQQWSRMSNGVDWSPLTNTLITGDFNGDHRSDVLLQAKYSGKTSYLLTGNASGAALSSTPTAISANAAITSDSARLIAGNFDGATTSGVGLYVQALTPNGTNYITNTVAATTTVTAHDTASATGTQPATAVGHTTGSFDVSSSGAATYTIPIVVPPGVSDMQPRLALSYNSSSGNGLVGVGWGLSGLSAISRCPATFAENGASAGVTLTSTDLFCLDGNKLRLTNGPTFTYGQDGSQYQTELETFSRVTAHGVAGSGPASFTVEGKDGLYYEYGVTQDSRIEVVGTTTPRTWALDKVTDRSGNYLTISYIEDTANGSYRPNIISYAANDNAGLVASSTVTFVWETRPSGDVLTSYFAGGIVNESNRLNRIETRYNNALIRKYQLSYNTSGSSSRSRLASVQECEGTTGTCLSPTIISWQDGQQGFDPEVDTGVTAYLGNLMTVDINGDGWPDLVYGDGPQAGGLSYRLATGPGTYGPENVLIRDYGFNHPNTYGNLIPIDLHSDGTTSFIIAVSGTAMFMPYGTRPPTSGCVLLAWNGNGFTESNVNLPNAGSSPGLWVADVDGDGYQDIVYEGSDGSGTFINVAFNSSGVFSTRLSWQILRSSHLTSSFNNTNSLPSQTKVPGVVADFNKDGRTDIYIYQVINGYHQPAGAWMLLTPTISGQTGSFVESMYHVGASTDNYTVADINGDGNPDLIYQTNPQGLLVPSGQLGTFVCMGTGKGLTSCVQQSFLWGYLIPIDWDGDGRTDILSSDAYSNWTTLISNHQSGMLPPISAGFSEQNIVPTSADINGDGLIDLLYVDPIARTLRYRLHSGRAPDVVNSITDGFGNNVTPQYSTLFDNSVYTKGTGATFPEADIRASIQVVKSYALSDGIGGSYSVSETYAGARMHLRGFGFEGFATRTEIDSRTGIQHITTYRQDFPYIGMVASSQTIQPNGKIISQLSNTYADLVTNSTPFNDRHFPYASSTSQISNEVSASNSAVDGSNIKQVVSYVSVDGYGNPTLAKLTTTDLTGSGQTFITQTTKTVTNDTANWCLGFVTQQQITNTVPNAAPLENNAMPTRTVTFVPDADITKCRVSKQTIEPNTSLQVATTFFYDQFGHAKQQTVSASGIADRNTYADYGTIGVFPISLTNAAGEASYKSYDYSQGVPLTATDPNGTLVSWVYDGFGRKVRENAPDGTAATWTFYSCGVANTYCGDSLLRYEVQQLQLDSSTAHNPIRLDMLLFDAFGRTLYKEAQTFSGAYSVVRSVYNNKGQLYQQSNPYFSGMSGVYSTYSYDLIGRVIQVQRPVSDSDPSLQTVSYNYSKLVQSVTDPLIHTTTQIRNAIGQVIQTTDAMGGNTNYQYDSIGNLAKTTDPAGNQITSTFNIVGFKKSSQDPDMGTWTYDYFPTGELKIQTDAKNQVAQFTYDNVGRLRTRIEPEGTATFTYGSSATDHNIGRLYAVSDSLGYAESYQYDAVGRPQTVKYTEDITSPYQVDYAYNNQGKPDSITYPESTPGNRLKLQYAYSYGVMSQVRDYATGTQYWTLNATNAASQPIDERLANGVRVISGFDSITGAINYRQSGNAGSTSNLQSLSYVWDKAGNLTQRQDSLQNLTETFYYNKSDGSFNLYRLDHSTLQVGSTTPTTNFSATYDSVGNILTKSDAGNFDYATAQAGCTYYAYSQPHAVRAMSGNAYCYDANGNMTKRAGSTIAWTSYNLPSLINSGSNYSQFTYGPSRQRWKQVANYGGTTETTIYIGGLIEKVTRNGLTEYKHYIAGGSSTAIYTRRSDGTSSTYYAASDHLGSSDVITDGTGAAIVRESFAAFGARRGSNWTGSPSTTDQAQFALTTRHGYTGHEELDNLNLIHMNGRVYDPMLGRFISADPFIQSPLSSQSYNRYSYVMNGPMSATDPSGYFSLSSLLNPFSKSNPLSPMGSVGKYLTGAALLPLASVFFSSEAIGTAFALGLTYETNRAQDRFFVQNPDMQWIPEFVSQVVAAVFPALWWVPVAVDAHFARINGGSPKDIIESAARAYAIHYVISGVMQGVDDWENGQGNLDTVTRDPNYINNPDIAATSSVHTQSVFVNGMENDEKMAAINALQQTGENQVTLFYNPTHGFIADLTESALMKISGTSSLGRQFAQIMSNSTGVTTIVAHSQGSLIVSNALSMMGQSGFHFTSLVTIIFNGPAANGGVADGLASSVGAYVTANSHFFDPVGNVVGLNTMNPFKIVGSIVASPTLFMGRNISPHSVYP